MVRFEYFYSLTHHTAHPILNTDNTLFIMTKTYSFTVVGSGYRYKEEVQAVNRPEAKRIAENQYGGPGIKLVGFNQV